MFLDRKDNRKQAELAYRQQLKQEINQRKSRVISNRQSQYRPQNQAFSLITNIQKEQNERKKKNSQYYAQLKQQMEEQKTLKSQLLAEKKRKQLEQQNKIKEEQKNLKQRYEEELMRQNKKGKSKTVAEPVLEPTPVAKSKFQNSQKELKPLPAKPNKVNQIENTRDKLYSLPTPANNQYDFSQLTVDPSLALNTYLSKIKNQTLDYVPRNSYKNNYYKELLGQRRRLQEETKQISQLNRLFNIQRYRKRQESRGLQELKNLQKMLDDKNVSYLDLQQNTKSSHNYDSGIVRSTKKQTRPIALSLRLNKDEWRKLD